MLEKECEPQKAHGSSGSETGMVKETTVLLLEPLKRTNGSQDDNELLLGGGGSDHQ